MFHALSGSRSSGSRTCTVERLLALELLSIASAGPNEEFRQTIFRGLTGIDSYLPCKMVENADDSNPRSVQKTSQRHHIPSVRNPKSETSFTIQQKSSKSTSNTRFSSAQKGVKPTTDSEQPKTHSPKSRMVNNEQPEWYFKRLMTRPVHLLKLGLRYPAEHFTNRASFYGISLDQVALRIPDNTCTDTLLTYLGIGLLQAGLLAHKHLGAEVVSNLLIKLVVGNEFISRVQTKPVLVRKLVETTVVKDPKFRGRLLQCLKKEALINRDVQAAANNHRLTESVNFRECSQYPSEIGNLLEKLVKSFERLCTNLELPFELVVFGPTNEPLNCRSDTEQQYRPPACFFVGRSHADASWWVVFGVLPLEADKSDGVDNRAVVTAVDGGGNEKRFVDGGGRGDNCAAVAAVRSDKAADKGPLEAEGLVGRDADLKEGEDSRQTKNQETGGQVAGKVTCREAAQVEVKIGETPDALEKPLEPTSRDSLSPLVATSRVQADPTALIAKPSESSVPKFPNNDTSSAPTITPPTTTASQKQLPKKPLQLLSSKTLTVSHQPTGVTVNTAVLPSVQTESEILGTNLTVDVQNGKDERYRQLRSTVLSGLDRLVEVFAGHNRNLALSQRTNTDFVVSSQRTSGYGLGVDLGGMETTTRSAVGNFFLSGSHRFTDPPDSSRGSIQSRIGQTTRLDADPYKLNSTYTGDLAAIHRPVDILRTSSDQLRGLNLGNFALHRRFDEGLPGDTSLGMPNSRSPSLTRIQERLNLPLNRTSIQTQNHPISSFGGEQNSSHKSHDYRPLSEVGYYSSPYSTPSGMDGQWNPYKTSSDRLSALLPTGSPYIPSPGFTSSPTHRTSPGQSFHRSFVFNLHDCSTLATPLNEEYFPVSRTQDEQRQAQARNSSYHSGYLAAHSPRQSWSRFRTDIP